MAGEVDLNALLAGPIIAMNDAQADAAASFFELFEQFAFEPPVDGDPAAPRRLRMISFVAERATAAGVERREISMPLLQMIPIGGVAIDSAKIQFSVALNAEPAKNPAGGPAAAPGAAQAMTGAVAPRRDVTMKARIAPGPATTAAASAGGAAVGPGNLQVEIVLKQIDLPAGYLDMIAETQGGMSRRLDPPAPAPAPGNVAPLFAATLAGELPPRLAPRQRLALILQIVPEPARIGDEGLILEYSADPPGSAELKVPNTLRRTGREPVSGRISVTIGDVREGTIPTIVIEGAADGPNGTPGRHVVRIPLPPIGPAG
jgi:hypothetical protein